MKKIIIKDLHDSIELDQQAMSTIHGGSTNARRTAGLLLQHQQTAKLSLLEQARNKQRAAR